MESQWLTKHPKSQANQQERKKERSNPNNRKQMNLEREVEGKIKNKNIYWEEVFTPSIHSSKFCDCWIENIYWFIFSTVNHWQ